VLNSRLVAPMCALLLGLHGDPFGSARRGSDKVTAER
jgi:hypothetical protein